MPWTKSNYPDSMKKLSPLVRTKAIQIANAMLKANKKMKEGVLIATAIKNAKNVTGKSELKVKGTVKKKVVAKKSEKIIKKKARVVVKKKVKVLAGNKNKKVQKTKVTTRPKASAVVAKKTQVSAKSKIKTIAAKKVITTKTKPLVQESPKRLVAGKIIAPFSEKELPEIMTSGEDMHFIHESGNVPPLNTFETHQVERAFQNKEEVALHQENLKVRSAKPSRKTGKRFH